MRVLLDTNAWLWFVLGDARHSTLARKTIQDPQNEVVISPASLWEIAIKISIGKYTLPQPYEQFAVHAIVDQGFQLLPILPAHTAALVSLPFHHRDPFDRLLVAQSMIENIPIISSDALLDQYPVVRF